MQTVAAALETRAAAKLLSRNQKKIRQVRVVLTTTNVNTAAPAAVAAFAVINQRKGKRRCEAVAFFGLKSAPSAILYL